MINLTIHKGNNTNLDIKKARFKFRRSVKRHNVLEDVFMNYNGQLMYNIYTYNEAKSIFFNFAIKKDRRYVIYETFEDLISEVEKQIKYNQK